MVAVWSTGQYAAAADFAEGKAKDSGSTDRLVWQLEWGAAERGAGRFARSQQAFAAANETLAYWDRKPDVSLSAEALSLVNNMTSLPYRGTAYDRIMVSTYQALNYLTLGENDKARVALNQALDRQREAVAANAKRLEKVREEAASGEKGNGEAGYAVSRAMADGQFSSALRANYGNLREMRAYGDYVNPFSVWLHGVYFMANAEGNSEVERAHLSLQRVATMVPGCMTVREDFAMIRKIRDEGAEIPELTYVIFETGQAPARMEERIDIPLFVVTDRLPYVGAAFPKLLFKRNYASNLVVSAAGREPVRTETVASMDNVIATDFDNALPEIVTRTLISMGIKATASYVLNETARHIYEQNSDEPIYALIYLGTLISTSVYSYSTTQADLRTWLTLPKEFQVARLETPPDRKLRLLAGQSPAVDLELIPGRVNVVYVRTTGVNTPLTVSQFDLRPPLAGAKEINPQPTPNHENKT